MKNNSYSFSRFLLLWQLTETCQHKLWLSSRKVTSKLGDSNKYWVLISCLTKRQLTLRSVCNTVPELPIVMSWYWYAAEELGARPAVLHLLLSRLVWQRPLKQCQSTVNKLILFCCLNHSTTRNNKAKSVILNWHMC